MAKKKKITYLRIKSVKNGLLFFLEKKKLISLQVKILNSNY